RAVDCDWERTLFIARARNFGFGLNGDAFETWARHLPRHEVGVVFHLGDEHFVTGLQEALAEGGGDEVHRLGGAAGEDHLLRRGCVDETLDGAAGGLELLGGKLAQMVHATVDVAVDGEVVAGQRVDDRQRFLRGGGVVEIDERAAVDRLLQYREILTVVHSLSVFCPVVFGGAKVRFFSEVKKEGRSEKRPYCKNSLLLF
ncbi:MAG: DUF2851 family protein, partial [Bacteroidales bacterium]|nr:DUF2851 family protein [Bacteroidales bacterium]